MDHHPTRPTPSADTPAEHALHDLCAPLTVIKGQAQLLQRRVRKGADPDKEVLLARLATIDRMVAHLETVIRSLHDPEREDASGQAADDRR